jgi:hypothetical protein
MPQPNPTSHTYAVKVRSEVSVSTFAVVTATNKPWVSARGDLVFGDDVPVPVIFPEGLWLAVYAVDPNTYLPINVVFPMLDKLPNSAAYK